jgi:hypothetical protein
VSRDYKLDILKKQSINKKYFKHITLVKQAYVKYIIFGFKRKPTTLFFS